MESTFNLNLKPANWGDLFASIALTSPNGVTDWLDHKRQVSELRKVMQRDFPEVKSAKMGIDEIRLFLVQQGYALLVVANYQGNIWARPGTPKEQIDILVKHMVRACPVYQTQIFTLTGTESKPQVELTETIPATRENPWI